MAKCPICNSEHEGKEHVFFFEEDQSAPLTQAERNRRYRKKNREKYNAYQRDLMRKIRANR